MILLVMGGEIRDFGLFRRRIEEAGLILAADSGARHILRAGARPAQVYSDKDSLSEEEIQKLENNGCQLILSPAEKNDTDGSYVLKEALSRGFTDIRIWGALGGRPDHSYGNLMLLQLALQGPYRLAYGPEDEDLPDVVIEDGGLRIFLAKRGRWIEGRKGDYLSLFALSPEVTGFRQEGLKYQPEGDRFVSEFPLGISNEFTGDRARLDWEKGVLLCMRVERGFSPVKNKD